MASHAPLDRSRTWEWLREIEELRWSLSDGPAGSAGSP
jgi:hypothetical protein